MSCRIISSVENVRLVCGWRFPLQLSVLLFSKIIFIKASNKMPYLLLIIVTSQPVAVHVNSSLFHRATTEKNCWAEMVSYYCIYPKYILKMVDSINFLLLFIKKQIVSTDIEKYIFRYAVTPSHFVITNTYKSLRVRLYEYFLSEITFWKSPISLNKYTQFEQKIEPK